MKAIDFTTIVTAGEALVEFVSNKKNINHDQTVNYSGPYPSGAPCIFIDQVARMGAKTEFVGCVGNDGFGRCLSQRLVEDKVGITYLNVDDNNSTGVAFVAYHDDGSRDFIFHLDNTAAINFKTDLPLFEQKNLVYHVSGSSLGNIKMRKHLYDAAKKVKLHGGKISFDPNVRPELFKDPEVKSIIYDLMDKCNCFLPSESDLSYLFPDLTEDQAIEKIQNIGVEVIGLKKGAVGSSVIKGSERFNYKGHSVEEIDPTGAGDCFCGTFVSLYYQGYSVQEAGKFANAAGALAVTKLGPMEGNSSLKQIEEFLKTDQN